MRLETVFMLLNRITNDVMYIITKRITNFNRNVFPKLSTEYVLVLA